MSLKVSKEWFTRISWVVCGSPAGRSEAAATSAGRPATSPNSTPSPRTIHLGNWLAAVTGSRPLDRQLLRRDLPQHKADALTSSAPIIKLLAPRHQRLGWTVSSSELLVPTIWLACSHCRRDSGSQQGTNLLTKRCPQSSLGDFRQLCNS